MCIQSLQRKIKLLLDNAPIQLTDYKESLQEYALCVEQRKSCYELLEELRDIKSHEVRKALKTIYRYKLHIGKLYDVSYTPEVSYELELPVAIGRVLNEVIKQRKLPQKFSTVFIDRNTKNDYTKSVAVN